MFSWNYQTTGQAISHLLWPNFSQGHFRTKSLMRPTKPYVVCLQPLSLYWAELLWRLGASSYPSIFSSLSPFISFCSAFLQLATNLPCCREILNYYLHTGLHYSSILPRTVSIMCTLFWPLYPVPSRLLINVYGVYA